MILVYPSGTQSSDYLSQIPPSPAFAAMLPQIAPSPASRQPTVLQPTLLGPPISRYHQLPPSAIPTTQPPRQPPTHPSSTDRKTASLEGIISMCIQTVYLLPLFPPLSLSIFKFDICLILNSLLVANFLPLGLQKLLVATSEHLNFVTFLGTCPQSTLGHATPSENSCMKAYKSPCTAGEVVTTAGTHM